MAHKLRILHLDGDAQDTELMIIALRDAGIDCEVVRGDTARLTMANEALAESERRLYDILDHIPAAIFLKDLNGRYVFANSRCQSVIGRERSERLLRQRRPSITLLHATNGTIGIAMALDHKPNLIFLDLHCPTRQAMK